MARQGLEKYDLKTIARYSCFVKVDEEVMQNLGGFLAANSHWAKTDFVKFVDANWEPFPVREKDEEWCKPDVYGEIGGCTEEDVRWMRISPTIINTAFYESLNGDHMAWELFYSPPPHIVSRSKAPRIRFKISQHKHCGRLQLTTRSFVIVLVTK